MHFLWAMDALILCYHNLVADREPAELLEARLAVPAAEFARQIHYLAARYAVCSLDALASGSRKRPALIVTFDDGYRSVLEHAAPVLRALHAPAYVFVNTAYVGGWNPRDKLMGLALHGSDRAIRDVEAYLGTPVGGRDPRARARRFVELRGVLWRTLASRGAEGLDEIDRLFAAHADDRMLGEMQRSRLASWDELRELGVLGVQAGNHTHRHLELNALPVAVVRGEISAAQRLLQARLGGEPAVISYPRGKISATVLQEAAAAGYRWGLTTVPGRLETDEPDLAAPRVVVAPQARLPQLMWKASPLRRWARRQVRRMPEVSAKSC